MARAGYCMHGVPHGSLVGCWQCAREKAERDKVMEEARKQSARNRFIDGLMSFADGTEDIDNLTPEQLDEALRKEGIDPERLAQQTRVVLQLIKMDPRWPKEHPNE